MLMYRSKWSTGTEDERYMEALKQKWQQGLGTVNLDSIQPALNTLLINKSSYPPSIPDFIALCTPKSGAPDAEEAWMIVAKHKQGMTVPQAWEHPVVLAASRDPQLDLTNLKRLPMRQAMRYWKPVYLKYVGRMVTGETFHFPEERVQLSDKSQEAVTPEEKEKSKQKAHSAFADWKNILGK